MIFKYIGNFHVININFKIRKGHEMIYNKIYNILYILGGFN